MKILCETNLLIKKLHLVKRFIPSKNDLTIILFFVASLFYNCYNPKHNQDLALLFGLLPNENAWKVIFSYPGRMTSLDKREEAKNEILSIINQTETNLEIHAYGLTDKEIVQAIHKARDRSVQVKIIADSERSYDLLNAYRIPYSIWSGSGLHHIKVILSDHKRMFTGTGNFTAQGLLTDYDGYFSFRFPQATGLEFERLINERLDYPVLLWENFFFYNSPLQGRNIQKRILDEVRRAKFKIQYLIYSHSDPLLSYELIRASKRGVLVEGIYDRPISDQGKILASILPDFGSRIFEEENEDRIDDGIFGLGGLNHHKSILIDDEILFSGSFNFSLNARDNNREIFYETRLPDAIKEFSKEFQRVKASSRIYPSLTNTEIDEFTMKTKFVYEWGSGLFRSQGVSGSLQAGNFSSISSGLFAGGRRTDLLAWVKESQIDTMLNPNPNLFFSRALIPMKNHEAEKVVGILSLDPNHSEGSVLTFSEEIDISLAHLWTWNGGWVTNPTRKISDRQYLWLGNALKMSSPLGWLVLEKRDGTGHQFACFYKRGRSFPSELLYLAEENQIQNLLQFRRKVETCSEI